MSDELKIRMGTPEDIYGMMDLALMACEENGFVNPDKTKLMTELWQALNLNYGMIGIIGKENGPIEGAILLRIGPMWYSHDMVVEEKAIFIHPDHRGAKEGRARKLVEFAKNAADELGIPLLIGVLSNKRTEGKIRLYERQLGKPTGAFFLYGAKTGACPVTEH
jgi:GNAT superfamily N-acetyltransferase